MGPMGVMMPQPNAMPINPMHPINAMQTPHPFFPQGFPPSPLENPMFAFAGPRPVLMVNVMDPRMLFAAFREAAQGAPSMQGQPPASPKVVEDLPHLALHHLPESEKHSPCAICQDDLGETSDSATQVIQLPCMHHFHAPCLQPWFKQSNVCPTCRFPLETDNPEYNAAIVAPERSKHFASRKGCVMASVGLCDGKLATMDSIISLSCSCRVCEECLNLQHRITGAQSSNISCPSCRKMVSYEPKQSMLPSPPSSPTHGPIVPTTDTMEL
jgi:hypothetical protein